MDRNEKIAFLRSQLISAKEEYICATTTQDQELAIIGFDCHLDTFRVLSELMPNWKELRNQYYAAYREGQSLTPIFTKFIDEFDAAVAAQ